MAFQSHFEEPAGSPREILQGGPKLLWGPGDRLRLFSKLRI